MRRNIRHRTLLNAILCVSIIVAPIQAALACTRVLWNDNKLAVVVAFTNPLHPPVEFAQHVRTIRQIR